MGIKERQERDREAVGRAILDAARELFVSEGYQNVWLGTSIEDMKVAWRADELRKIPAVVRFISYEPALGPLDDLDLSGISWVIYGGESGPGARPIERGWVRDIRDHCIRTDTAFFFKQWGGVQKKKAGRRLDRRLWSQQPAIDRVSPALAAG